MHPKILDIKMTKKITRDSKLLEERKYIKKFLNFKIKCKNSG